MRTIHGPNGLKLVLDPSQIFPDDPGAGTPAMVYRCDRRGRIIQSATYWCAWGEGELMDDEGVSILLKPKEAEWVESVEGEVDLMYRREL